MAYKSPNKIHMDIIGLTGGAEVVSDGSSSYVYSAMTNSYSISPATKYPINMMLQTMGDISPLKLTKQAVINNLPCNVYSGVTKSELGKGKITIAVDSKSKLVQQVMIVMPQIETPQGGKFSVTVTQDFTNQQVNAAVNQSEFRFQPPAGAQKAARGNIPAIMSGFGGE